MSRIYLLSSNTSTDPYPVYPLGMATVASALVNRGHEVYQFDFLVSNKSIDQLHETLVDFNPDFVGISLRNIDAADSLSSDIWYLNEAKMLVERIREITAVPIIIGGSAFSIMPEEILEYLRADHGIAGEGERAFSSLIDFLKEGRSAPRILDGRDYPLSMGEMCFPLIEKELIRFYIERSGLMSIQTKRGCPHKCIYCTYPSLEGKQFRTREPRAVADHIERMKSRYNVDTFCFTDSVFNDTSENYLEVAEELLRQEIGIRWSAFFRPKEIGRKELKLLKRSGLYAMEVGTDASSDDTLRGLNKEFSFSDVIDFTRMSIDEEIPCCHFIIFGGPNETEETVKKGLENINELGNCLVVVFSGIRILPGTDLHTLTLQEGMITEKTPMLKPSYYFSPGIKPEIMNETIQKAFRGRRDRFFPPSKGQDRIKVMNRFGYQGILWDKLISFKKN